MKVLQQVLSEQALPVLALAEAEALSEEIVLPIGGPTRADLLAPQIHALRVQGMSWRAIGKELAIGSGDALTIFRQRYGHVPEGLNAAS